MSDIVHLRDKKPQSVASQFETKSLNCQVKTRKVKNFKKVEKTDEFCPFSGSGLIGCGSDVTLRILRSSAVNNNSGGVNSRISCMIEQLRAQVGRQS